MLFWVIFLLKLKLKLYKMFHKILLAGNGLVIAMALDGNKGLILAMALGVPGQRADTTHGTGERDDTSHGTRGYWTKG